MKSHSVACPGSKSITQRALIIAALSQRESTIEGALLCDDSQHLIALLKRLGTDISIDTKQTIRIRPAEKLAITPEPVFCGNAGTTLRFGSCFSLLIEERISLDGDKFMRKRPIKGLLEALGQLGIKTLEENNGCPPITLERKDNAASLSEAPNIIDIDMSISSQYASGIALISPHFKSATTIRLKGNLVSYPYFSMTLSMMEKSGISIERQSKEEITVYPGKYDIKSYAVEPDWSTAAFLFAAATLANIDLKITDLVNPSHSLQGDSQFNTFLKAFNKPSRHLDLSHTPDLIAPLAALAALIPGKTIFSNIGHLRFKESDRVAVLSSAFRLIGVEHSITPSSMTVYALENIPSYKINLDPKSDHRMAMAFGLMQLRIPQIEISNPSCVSKSFPEFWTYLDKIKRLRDDNK